MQQNGLKGVILVLAGAICYATKAIFVKLAFRYGVDGITMLTFRMLFSLPFYVAVLLYISRREKAPEVQRSDYVNLVIAGLFGYYLASFFDFYGLQFISASLERLILFIYPTMTLFFGWLLYRRPIRRIQLLAILISYAGIAVAFRSDMAYTAADNLFKGAVLVFFAAITYAFYLAKSDVTIRSMGSIRFTCYSLILSCAAVFIHYAVVHEIDLFRYEWPVYLYALLIAVIATVIPTFLMAEGIKHIGSNNMSILASIGPVVTIVLSTFILDEPFTGMHLLGTVLVLSGIVLIGRATGKRTAST